MPQTGPSYFMIGLNPTVAYTCMLLQASLFTAGATMCMFFVTGGLRTVGLLFIEFVEVFDASQGLTALTLALIAAGFALFGRSSSYITWTSVINPKSALGHTVHTDHLSVSSPLAFISAPFANGLGARFSFRAVALVGGTLAALATFLTAFATNIVYVICVLGTFTGKSLEGNGCPTFEFFEESRETCIFCF